MPANPFVSARVASALSSLVEANFRLATTTVAVDDELTNAYCALAGMSGALFTGDALNGMHAVIWTLVDLFDALPPQDVQVVETCDHEQCIHQRHASAAFIEAVTRKDHTAAMNVVKAIIRQANADDADPAVMLAGFYGDIVSNTARATLQGVRDSAAG